MRIELEEGQEVTIVGKSVAAKAEIDTSRFHLFSARGPIALSVERGQEIERHDVMHMLEMMRPFASEEGCIAIDHCIYTLER